MKSESANGLLVPEPIGIGIFRPDAKPTLMLTNINKC